MTTTPTTTARYNVLAIVGFILAFVVSIIGSIISLVALLQVNRTGERGRNLAIAGIIVGIVIFIINLAVVVPAVTSMTSQLNP